MKIKAFIDELKRRNVFRVATAYAIAGWLIIQVFATIAPQLGFPDWIAPLVTTLVLIGFPLALIFAWAFELTPEGIQKSNDVEITESVTASTGKTLNRIIISVLSVALIFLLTERIFFAESTLLEKDQLEAEKASIAVLPFVNMSSDEENEYFSDGLSEELLNAIAKVEDMQVAGRTSSFKFKGQNENLKLIGEELGVSNILEGSVRKDGSRLRITAQLIRVEDGFHIWSETYDRELTVSDIFDIQEEISRHVLEELKVRLLPEEDAQLSSRPTQDIEAYEAYLRGKQLLRNRQPEEIKEAIEHFNRAITMDPGFALAYAERAIAYHQLSFYGNDLSYPEAKPLIRQSAEQALALDSELGMAHAAMARSYFNDLDISKTIASYEKAIELEPNNAMILMWYAGIIGNTEPEKEIELYEKAIELDPLHPLLLSRMMTINHRKGDMEAAISLYEKNVRLNPNYSQLKIQGVSLYRDFPIGKLDKAFLIAYDSFINEPNDIYAIANLSYVAIDLQLLGLSEELVEAAIINNAGERAINYMQWRLAAFSEDYLNYASIQEARDGMFDQYDDEFFNMIDELRILMILGDKKTGFERLIEHNSRFDGTFNDEFYAKYFEEQGLYTLGLIYSLYFLADHIDEESFKNYVNKLEEHLFDSINDEIEAWDLAWLSEFYALSGNHEKAVEAIQSYYFEHNYKLGSEELRSPLGRRIFTSNLYDNLFQRIDADLDSMRTIVIDELTSKGEWKEEWLESE